jgi:uncharacterized protein YegP (UPF0339 family)
MATATTKSRGAKQVARRTREVRVTESMQFLIFEENGGDYHWTIVARDGVTLVRSGGFASYDDAEKDARHVRDGAAAARFEPRAGAAGAVDLSERRRATRDAADAERWLDEGGSFSSEAVATWQAPR